MNASRDHAPATCAATAKGPPAPDDIQRINAEAIAKRIRDLIRRGGMAPGGLVFLPGPALRLCGYCKTWNRKPCGDGCHFSLSAPTWEDVLAAAQATPLIAGDKSRGEP